MTPSDLAGALHVSVSRVDSLMRGDRPIDAEMALRLARFFGGDAEPWLFLQHHVDLWDAQAAHADEIEQIVPIDQTQYSRLDDDPLPPELLTEIRARMDDVDDPTRWMIVSDILERETSFGDHFLYYDVEDGMWVSEFVGATQFKRKAQAEALLESMRSRSAYVVEVDPGVVAARFSRVRADMELFRRVIRSRRTTTRKRHISESLRSTEEVVAYLELAAMDGAPQAISTAVDDALPALRRLSRVPDEGPHEQVDELKDRAVRGSRADYERVMGTVGDGESNRRAPLAFAVSAGPERGGRWMAEVPEIPGVLAHGATRDQAVARVEALALRVIADRLESNDVYGSYLDITFDTA